jgi:hypothetical protein
MFGVRTKALARQQPDRGDVIQVRAYYDLPYTFVARRKDEFVGRVLQASFVRPFHFQTRLRPIDPPNAPPL